MGIMMSFGLLSFLWFCKEYDDEMSKEANIYLPEMEFGQEVSNEEERSRLYSPK